MWLIISHLTVVHLLYSIPSLVSAMAETTNNGLTQPTEFKACISIKTWQNM
jgi:hypothetical protein